MKYTQLPYTDIQVSNICLGGMSFGDAGSGWHHWTLNQADTTEVIATAFKYGINFIDTANSYANGTSETYIGHALKALHIPRTDIVLASKVFFNEGGCTAKAIHREIDGTLQRLQTDYLDLYILHRFDYQTPIEETLLALHELVTAGKVRAIGASEMYAYQFHHLIHACEKNGWTPFSTMQCHYNLIYRESEREMLPLCREYGILPTPYSPMASGHLARADWDTDSVRSQTDTTMKAKYDTEQAMDLPIIRRVQEVADNRHVSMAQIALAWHWSYGQSVPIVGCSSPARVESAVGALTINLTHEEIAYLEELYHPHALVGPNARPGEKATPGSYHEDENE